MLGQTGLRLEELDLVALEGHLRIGVAVPPFGERGWGWCALRESSRAAAFSLQRRSQLLFLQEARASGRGPAHLPGPLKDCQLRRPRRAAHMIASLSPEPGRLHSLLSFLRPNLADLAALVQWRPPP